MANTSITGTQTTAVTLKDGNAGVDDTLTVSASGTLKTTATAVLMNLTAAPAGGGIVITNNGTIQSTGDRTLDTTGAAAGSKITLNNNGSIISNGPSKADVFRVADDIVGGVITVNNTGTIQSTGQTNDSQGLRFGKSYNSTITISNSATGKIITANADAIRAGNNSTITNYGTITANGSSTPTAKNPANAIDISIGQSSTINNYGTITGAGNGLGADVGNNIPAGGAATPANYNLTNYAAGVITGQVAAGVASSTATIVNSGTIQGLGLSTLPGGATTANYDGDGVNVTGIATITNTGTIRGVQSSGVNAVTGRTNLSEGVVIGGGTITNSGTIEGGYSGVTVDNVLNANQTRSGTAALTLVNQAGGLIKGDTGFAIRSENKTADGSANAALTNDVVTNYGTIVGNGTIPTGTVYMNGGTTTKDPNTIGVLNGVTYSAADAGNARFILGDGAAIQLGEGDDTLTNYGTITGNSGRAISLEGGNDTLNLFTGGTVTGRIDGGVGTDTLTLDAASGQATGTLSNVVNFELLNVKGGQWTIGDAETYANGITVGSSATLTLGSAASLGGAIDDEGALVVQTAGSLNLTDAISGAGALTMSGSGTLTLSGANTFSGGIALNAGTLDIASSGGAGSGAITFGSGAQTLIIEQAALTQANGAYDFANHLKSIGVGDAIRLVGVGSETSAVYDANTKTLTISGDAGSETVTLHLEASTPPAGYAYGVTADGAGGAILALDKIATVQDVTGASTKASVKAGDSFTISIAFDKTVAVSGTAPVLHLSDGGIATLSPDQSTATKLVFVATVSAGENAAGVQVVSVDNAASVKDAAHVAVDFSAAFAHAAVGPTVDTTAPDVSITSAGGLTNQPAQTITGAVGAGDAGVTVIVFDGNTELGRTTADNAGKWSLDVTLASNADHSVHAIATDAAGNVGRSADVAYTLDTVAPNVTVTGYSALVNHASQTVSGKVDVDGKADSVGTVVTITDGSDVVGHGTVQSDGSWSADITLSGDRQHVLKAVDTDMAGNAGYSTPFSVTLDTVAPDTAIGTHPAAITNATNANFTFTGTDTNGGSGVVDYLVSLDGGTFTSAASGSVAYTGLVDGQHNLAVKAVDAAGNADATPASYNWTVDTVAPDTTITAAPKPVTNQTRAHIEYTGSDNASGTGVASYLVSVDGSAFASTTATSLDLTGLSEGQHNVRVEAVDAAGNVDATPASVAWTVDTVAPDTSITAKPALNTNSANAHFDFTGVDGSGTGVVSYLTSLDGGAFTATTATSSDFSNLADGKHTFAVKAVDAAGNVDATPASYGWTVDTTAAHVDFTSEGGVVHTAQQVVSGTTDLSEVGRTITIYEGSSVLGTAKVSSEGRWATSVLLNGAGAHNLTASETDLAGNIGTTTVALSYTFDTSAPTFWKGNLVLSVYGNGDGSGEYDDNAATPIVLQQITTSGEFVNQIVLPQATIGKNSVISGEYGSSSEGSLQLTGDGKSLLIAGYGVNAYQYNDGGAAVYGDAALAQSTSLTGQSKFVPVSRVIAQISADGSVDTSTVLFNVFDGNNPRSVASVDGSTYYISGQGIAGDTTQGVFVVQHGSSVATSIDHSTDTRTAVIYDGQLYVSRDSKQPKTGSVTGTANISTYKGLPTGETKPIVLDGLDRSVTLTNLQTNTINHAGDKVYLDPENFFFANSKTLYVADGGTAKIGGVGDGGLQKWVFNDANGKWELQYTLSVGLNIVQPGTASGTTGLIGLTGKVVGDTVQLYATNQTVGDTDQKYLYGITDHLSDTSGAGKSFTTLVTAAEGTNIRGVSFAPSTEAPTVSIDGEGGFTNKPVLTLSGEVDLADAGTTVIIKDGSATLGSALVGLDGTWSAQITLTGEGNHVLVASDTDGYGHTGSASVTYTLDTIAPTVAIASTGGVTNEKAQTISGTVSTQDAGTTVTLTDGAIVIGTALVEDDGSWSADVTLSKDGTHVIVASDTDAAGNTGQSSVTYTLDTVAPTVAMITKGGLTTNAAQTISGTVGKQDAGTTVTLTDKDTVIGTATVNADGTWSTDVTLSGDGTHVIVASDTDTAGNTGSASLTYSLDTTAPDVAIAGSGGLVKVARQVLNGTGEAGTMVTILDNNQAIGTARVAANGTWTTSVTLKGEGQHVLVAFDADKAGNVGQSTAVMYLLDTVAPVAPTLAIATPDGSKTLPKPVLTGTAEAGATVTLYDGKAVVATTMADAVTGAYSFATVSTLTTVGAHTLTTRAQDAAGNLSGASPSQAVQVAADGMLTITQPHADKTKDVYKVNIQDQSYVAEHDFYNSSSVLVDVSRTNANKSLNYTYHLDTDTGTKTVDTYSASGRLITDVITQADGTSDTKTYAADGKSLVSEAIRYPAKAGQKELSDTFYYNTKGVLINETQVHADKSQDVYLTNITGRSYTAEHDVYNTKGVMTDVIRTHDDKTLDYTSHLDTSTGTKTVDTYSSNGHLVSELVTRTDGSSDAYQYTSDVLTKETHIHVDKSKDVFDYQIANKDYVTDHYYYSPDGKIATADLTYKDGSHLQTAYQMGQTLTSTASVADTFKSFGSDTFEFAKGFGKDVVTLFHAGSGAGHDVLTLDTSEAASFQALQDNHMITAVGRDTLITLSNTDTILLKNVAPSALTAADFHFQDHGLFHA